MHGVGGRLVKHTILLVATGVVLVVASWMEFLLSSTRISAAHRRHRCAAVLGILRMLLLLLKRWLLLLSLHLNTCCVRRGDTSTATNSASRCAYGLLVVSTATTD